MQGGSFTSWGASLGVLTGAWVVMVAVVGSLLPATGAGGGAGVVGMDGPMEVRRQSFPLWVERKSPCTNEVVSLDLRLDLEVKSRLSGEWADFVVQAWLSSAPSSSAPDQIEPVRAHFGFSSPNYGKAGHVFELQTAVLGQPVPLELILGLEQGVDGKGQLIVQPGQARLVCG